MVLKLTPAGEVDILHGDLRFEVLGQVKLHGDLGRCSPAGRVSLWRCVALEGTHHRYFAGLLYIKYLESRRR